MDIRGRQSDAYHKLGKRSGNPRINKSRIEEEEIEKSNSRAQNHLNLYYQRQEQQSRQREAQRELHRKIQERKEQEEKRMYDAYYAEKRRKAQELEK